MKKRKFHFYGNCVDPLCGERAKLVKSIWRTSIHLTYVPHKVRRKIQKYVISKPPIGWIKGFWSHFQSVHKLTIRLQMENSTMVFILITLKQHQAYLSHQCGWPFLRRVFQRLQFARTKANGSILTPISVNASWSWSSSFKQIRIIGAWPILCAWYQSCGVNEWRQCSKRATFDR